MSAKLDEYADGQTHGIEVAFRFVETLMPSVRAADLLVAFERTCDCGHQRLSHVDAALAPECISCDCLRFRITQ